MRKSGSLKELAWVRVPVGAFRPDMADLRKEVYPVDIKGLSPASTVLLSKSRKF